MTIYDQIKRKAAEVPNTMAIAAPGSDPLTYEGLLSQIEYAAKELNGFGVSRNDRVAIVAPEGPEMAVAFLATASVATCAPLNPAYREKEFEFYLTDLAPKVLIVHSAMDSPAVSVARTKGIPVIELRPDPESGAGAFTLKGSGFSEPARAEFAGPEDVALVLHTSGTTARPKMVPLTQTNLCTSARNIGKSLGLADGDRCLNVMPMFHIHGLIGALLSSIASGAGVVCTPGFRIEPFFDWMKEYQPTWYTAVPTMHQAVLARAEADPEIIQDHTLRFIRSCSAALPPPVIEGLEKVFRTPVIEAYGMTEASHQMASNPLPPGLQKPGSVGLASGTEVAVMAEDGSDLLSSGENGEIVIKGANVTPGYADNPDANAKSFAAGWFRTGDQGYLDSDGFLFLTGRLKEIINRGGEKISPREIDEVLMEHSAVAQAVAFALPHETLVEDVAAAVVLRKDRVASEKELRDHAFARLADFKVPSQVVIVDKIPKGPTGKLQRIGLYEKLASILEVEFTEPQNRLERLIAKIWTEVLGVETVGKRDNFFALGGDSLASARVLARLKQESDVDLPFNAVFVSPTVEDLAKTIEDLDASPEDISTDLTSLMDREDDVAAPLSFTQQRLWFFHQWDPSVSIYNRPTVLRLKGDLEVRHIEAALYQMVRRHKALRTGFKTVDGTPEQEVVPPPTISLSVEDLTQLPESEIFSEAWRRMEVLARQNFNLSTGNIFRARLFRVASGEHLLLLVTHHLVFDSWSESLFINELGQSYSALCSGKQAELPELSFHYPDFAAWQTKNFQGENVEKQLAYWKLQLGKDLQVIDLPFDRSRPALQTYSGATHVQRLPDSLIKALKGLSNQSEATLFMTMLAAFQVLLYRYTEVEDVSVGSPVSGRTHPEVEKLVGVFINTLVLRTDLSGKPTFRELLNRVRRVCVGAYANQEFPLEKLVEVLNPVRDLSRTPLFQVMFNFENVPEIETVFDGVDISIFDFDTGIALYDLTLEVVRDRGSYKCLFNYNTDLFDDTTIHRMAAHYQTLLEGIAADPDQPITDLPLLTPEERHRILVEWNDTKIDYPKDNCIHHLFEEQVERLPDAVAVEFEDKVLTYRELNNRANQLAHHLQKLGVGPEVLVGICMERSLELVVGLLGILKTGGAYVPLDPGYPKERLVFMLKDSDVPVLLTREALLARLPDFNDFQSSSGRTTVVRLDADRKEIDQSPENNPKIEASPENLAYVMYTSGSTGLPKGVCVPHRGVVRLVRNTDYIRLSPEDTVLQAATISFDAATFEIWGSLLNGARLVIAAEHPASLAELGQVIRENAITIVFLTTNLFHLMVEERIGDLGTVRQLLTGGDVLSVSHAGKAFAELKNCRLVNCYGPTENTTFTSWFQIDASCRGAPSIPIGRPVANTQTYILDSFLEPVPIGVPGELYAGGDGLARGYLNRPELTREKFIPNPFGDEQTDRLYKTGDLARYLPDGTIEFLGRMDHQVKIRGFRVEPAEIETALCRHSRVAQALVVATEDRPGEKSLVAYIVPEGTGNIETGDLRRYLKEMLPAYMVPAGFVFLDEMPLTPNGKVDRRELPDAKNAVCEKGGVFEGPRTDFEKTLVEIWEEVLGTGSIGIHDNFFHVGGDSLRAARVISRLQGTLEIDIALRRIFEYPTVAGFSEYVEQGNSVEKTSYLRRSDVPFEREELLL